MLSFLFTETPLKFFVQNFWRDEAFSYVLAKQDVLNLLVVTAKDFNPPLYYLVLKLWMLFFGSSEIGLRSLSLVFFFATVVVANSIMLDAMHLDRKKRSVYLLIFLLNPLLIYYAFEARMYSMFSFFATLSFYAYLQKKKRMYYISTILGLYTHYFMVLVLLTQFVFTLLNNFRGIKMGLSFKKMFIPFAAFLPWLIFMFSQKTTLSGSFWIPTPLLKDILTIPSVIYTGYEKGPELLNTNFLIWGSLILIAMIILGYLKIRNDKQQNSKRLFLFFVLWAFLPSVTIFLLSFYKSLFIPRYLIFTNVGLLLLIVLILEHIKTELRIAFIIILIVITYNYNIAQMQYKTKTDYTKMFKEIKVLAKNGDVVYVTNELDFFTAQYYFDQNRVLIYGKSYEELPAFVGKALIPENKLTNILPLYPKKAFVVRDNQHYDIASIY